MGHSYTTLEYGIYDSYSHRGMNNVSISSSEIIDQCDTCRDKNNISTTQQKEQQREERRSFKCYMSNGELAY